LVGLADVLLGNEEDFGAALGFTVPGTDGDLVELDARSHGTVLAHIAAEFRNLAVVASTLRAARTATRNDWGAVCWSEGQLFQAPWRDDLEILDRVGGGDSFASGLIYGFLSGMGPQAAVEYGAAHGALAMSTPGDTSMVTLAEVERVRAGHSARVTR
jgi:2-dehydro-3-deoxygluconokinase